MDRLNRWKRIFKTRFLQALQKTENHETQIWSIDESNSTVRTKNTKAMNKVVPFDIVYVDRPTVEKTPELLSKKSKIPLLTGFPLGGKQENNIRIKFEQPISIHALRSIVWKNAGAAFIQIDLIANDGESYCIYACKQQCSYEQFTRQQQDKLTKIQMHNKFIQSSQQEQCFQEANITIKVFYDVPEMKSSFLCKAGLYWIEFLLR